MSQNGTRKSVQTYISEHQHNIWKDEAAEMGVSLAEYTRIMIQAGRRDFTLPSQPNEIQNKDNRLETPSSHVTPGVDALKTHVLEIIESEDYPKRDDIVNAVYSDLDEKLAQAFEELQRNDRIYESWKHDGYAVADQ